MRFSVTFVKEIRSKGMYRGSDHVECTNSSPAKATPALGKTCSWVQSESPPLRPSASPEITTVSSDGGGVPRKLSKAALGGKGAERLFSSPREQYLFAKPSTWCLPTSVVAIKMLPELLCCLHIQRHRNYRVHRDRIAASQWMKVGDKRIEVSFILNKIHFCSPPAPSTDFQDASQLPLNIWLEQTLSSSLSVEYFDFPIKLTHTQLTGWTH